MLELTHNHGTESDPTFSGYASGNSDPGKGYGHIAIEVDDAAATCERIRAGGGLVTREAGPVKGGTTVIAFVQDPDGYKIELIERRALTATVKTVDRLIDAASNTFRVRLELPNPGGALPAGLRCKVDLPLPGLTAKTTTKPGADPAPTRPMP